MALLIEDLDEIFQRSEEDLRSIVNERVLLTGGTGFVGSWLTESWNDACCRLGGRGELWVVSRNPKAFTTHHNLDSGRVNFIQSDIRTVTFPAHLRFGLVIHSATPARATLNTEKPSEMVSIILQGQQNLLEQLSSHSCPRFLFTSSGAIYGSQPVNVDYVDEEQLTGPDLLNPRAAYHEGKRMAEMSLTLAASEGVVEPVIARLFAFFGPYLPLDEHFAIGNFVRDAMASGPIVIKGDGTTVRSYQYPVDMATWLWALAKRGKACRAYNVGSDQAFDLRAVAQRVADAFGTKQIEIRGLPTNGNPIDRYVPSVDRAQNELGLSNLVSLENGLQRWRTWLRV